MAFRISPAWWPVLLVASPVLLPMLAVRNRRFRENRRRAEAFNQSCVEKAKPLDLPEVESLELTVLVEEKTEEGFFGEPGVSYLLKTNEGSLLFDIAFGPEKPALAHNVKKLGLELGRLDALAISHLHADHMGGFPARQTRRVTIPPQLGLPWQRINDEDLSRTISVLNQVSPKRVLLSAHDSCDHALARFERELSAETTVLKAGATYVI